LSNDEFRQRLERLRERWIAALEADADGGCSPDYRAEGDHSVSFSARRRSLVESILSITQTLDIDDRRAALRVSREIDHMDITGGIIGKDYVRRSQANG
jgi:hypothetical protein